MIEGLIHQEDITILNLNASNKIFSDLYKAKLVELQVDHHCGRLYIRPFPIIGRLSRYVIKDVEYLEKNEKCDLLEIFRTLYLIFRGYSS